jgi:hypothetical protein
MQNRSELVCDPPEVSIDRKEVIIDSQSSLVTILRPSSRSTVNIVYDQDLVNNGIITEPSGFLIDQKATANLLGRQAGYLPEDYLAREPDRYKIGIMGNHFGWQKEAFIVKNGRLVLIKNDVGKLTGRFPTLLKRDGVWSVEDVYIKDGETFGKSTQQLIGATGFNGAQIV